MYLPDNPGLEHIYLYLEVTKVGPTDYAQVYDHIIEDLVRRAANQSNDAYYEEDPHGEYSSSKEHVGTDQPKEMSPWGKGKGICSSSTAPPPSIGYLYPT